MIKKILAGVGMGLASVALVAAPSFAAPTSPGVLETINASGGTNASDGLKIDVAFGQIQIGRNGDGQLYPNDYVPDPSSYAYEMSNYPVISLDNGSGTHDDIGYGTDWNSFTSEATLTDSNRSGVVINHLTYGSGTSLVTADLTITYTYPNEYFTVKLDLTGLGSDWNGYSHRIYWHTDSYLEGSDEGFEFGGTTPGGQTVAGVYSQAGTQIEAFRQVAGQSLNWFAGDYECPGSGGDADACGVESQNGFMPDFVDFPNVIAQDPLPIDNGFGVNKGVSTASTDSITFDLLFAACNNQTPLPCADTALGTAALPDTGASDVMLVSLSVSGAMLLALGVVLLALRRRQRA